MAAWRSQFQPTVVEKIVAGLCYFTFGMTGLLYILFNKTGSQSQLFRFHMYQAVLLSILAVMISWAVNPLIGILVGILSAIAPSSGPFFLQGIEIIFDILHKTYFLLLLYGSVWAFLGKFAEVPFVSNLVRQNMRF